MFKLNMFKHCYILKIIYAIKVLIINILNNNILIIYYKNKFGNYHILKSFLSFVAII